MFQIEVTEQWRRTFAGGHIGVLLVSHADTGTDSSPLAARKRQIEATLREKFANFSRTDFYELETLREYRNYYRQFNKSYHVQLQLESVAQKGKSLPTVAPLVDVNFMAELQTFILSAGHDADRLDAPLRIDCSLGGEEFTQINGTQQTLKANDMMMADRQGVICTILYGQDQRTAISAQTKRALYVAYAPYAIPHASVERHLATIVDNVRLFAPSAEIALQAIYTA